jgi:hypothetical protein
MIEQGIFQFILNNTALDTLMPESSLFQGVIPDNSPSPSLMFRKITGTHDQTMQGPSGFVERRYQFTAEASDAPNTPGSGYVLVQTLLDTLRQQFNGFTGTLPDGTRVFATFLDLETDEFDADAQKHVAIQDYKIQFIQNP